MARGDARRPTSPRIFRPSNGAPVVVAADYGPWLVDYADHLNGWPRTVRIRSKDAGRVDATARLDQLEVNTADRRPRVRASTCRPAPSAMTLERSPRASRRSASERTVADGARSLTLPAFAKINLDLRILGVRPDGYHDLRTIFQSLALHDSLTFTARRARSRSSATIRRLPTDRRNLVWKAASLLWRTVGPRRGETPAGCRRRLAEAHSRRRPDWAAAAPTPRSRCSGSRACGSSTWTCRRSAGWPPRLGADVPFFLVGGTALGLGRGDDIYPLVDLPRTVRRHRAPALRRVDGRGLRLVRQRAAARRSASRRAAPLPDGWPEWAVNLRNDLEPAVTRASPDDRPDQAGAGRRRRGRSRRCRGRARRCSACSSGSMRPRRTAARPGAPGLASRGHADAVAAPSTRGGCVPCLRRRGNVV